MTAKEKFVEFVDGVINSTEDMDEEILQFWSDYKNCMKQPVEMTEKGAAVLRWFQENPTTIATAKKIAEAIGLTSRSVSGSMRKLVTDGYVEKIDGNPSSYKITDKGKTYVIDK